MYSNALILEFEKDEALQSVYDDGDDGESEVADYFEHPLGHGVVEQVPVGAGGHAQLLGKCLRAKQPRKLDPFLKDNLFNINL
uniref:Uncharacterized protein n=1 Tax=Meloidogyne incognita TaxID=6306 RepID=A0A914LDR7_MELIC